MRKAGFQLDSIYLLLGDNDICTRDGRPQVGLDMWAFPAVFHDRRETAVALCEDVVGWGNCCSSLPFPRWERKRSFNHRIPHNKIAGNYLRMLSHYRPERHYRPECDLPSVQQSNRASYIMAGKLFPRRPDRTLFKKDGIHPARNAFDQLLRPSLDAWIARCKRFQ